MAYLMSTPLMAGSITNIIENLAKSGNHMGNASVKVIAIVALLIGAWQLVAGVIALRKHQGGGLQFAVGLLALIIGGYFFKGWSQYTNVASNQAGKAVNSALEGNG